MAIRLLCIPSFIRCFLSVHQERAVSRIVTEQTPEDKAYLPTKGKKTAIRLIGLSVLVLLLTNLKGLASLKRSLSLGLALLALETEHQLLGLLRLHITLRTTQITFLWKIGLV